jgi:hypothetical protein
VRTRVRLVWVAIATYVATLGVLTWQALSAQSIVHPGGAILLTAVVVTIAALLAAVIVLAGGSGSATRRLTTP